MKKFFITVFVFCLVVVVGVIVGRNMIARIAVSSGIKALTGVGVDIKTVDIGLFKPYLHVAGVVVKNPAGYDDPVMADIPELYIAYDLPAFMKNNVHLPELRFNMKELVIIRDKNGKVNINSLTAVMPKENGKAPAPIKIDVMELTIGRVVYKDYSSGKLMVSEYKLNLHEKFTNITDTKSLVGLVLSRALKNANLTEMLNLDVDSLISGGAVQAKGAVKNVATTAKDAVKSTGDELKKLLKF
jgi:hypothetical protein